MRTAFICVTVTVTSPLERIYISAGVTRRPFGFQPKGWCLSRSRNGSAHFRRYFAMGKIRGTPCMRSHMAVYRATAKYFSNSFVFKNKIEKEGLPRCSTPALGAGGLRFKSGRPDQNISRILFRLSRHLSAQYPAILPPAFNFLASILRSNIYNSNPEACCAMHNTDSSHLQFRCLHSFSRHAISP